MMNDFYPSASFYFTVTIIDELEQVSNSFQEVSGIDVNLEIEELNDPNQFKYKLPNSTKYSNLVLSKGLEAKNSKLLAWCKDTLRSNLTDGIRTKNLEVKLLNEKGETILCWRFTNAWPVKMKIDDLFENEEGFAIESIEFAYATFERVL